MVSRVLKSVAACCALETSELCPSESTRKRRWFCKIENVSANGFIIASDAKIAPLPSHSILRTDKYYSPSFVNESDLFEKMVVQEMAAKV